MHRVITVYGRKILSVTLIFNALLTISFAVGLLWGFYVEHWTLYNPYLINGNLLWLAIAAAIVNLFPAAYVGKVHTGRLWFHHYVYGFFVLCISSLWIVFFTSVSLITMFFVNTTNVSVNVGRFFFLGGLSLVLDDLPDVHSVTFHGLKWLKSKAHDARRAIHVAQLLLGFATLYLFFAVLLAVLDQSQWLTPANIIQMGTLLVTTFSCFGSVRGKIWHKLYHKHETKH